MRILQINAVYKTKSTGRIVMEMHKYFQKKGHKSFVAYATENTDQSGDRNVFRVGNILDHKLHALAYRIDNMQGCHSHWATKVFLTKIKEISPDIILTHNLHSNFLDVPFFLKEVKKLGIKVVLALHDCWFMTGGCYHYTANNCDKWLSGCHDCLLLGKAAEKKYKINCDVFDYVNPTVIATSKWIETEAKKSLLSKRTNISMIYDWIDTEVFFPRNGQHIREKLNIGNRILILGVSTGWSIQKGQLEMIEVAKAMPEARIVLVGSQKKNTNYPDNVIVIPFTDSKEELAELYSAADVFFNPSKQETFGLVSGEALACGTPIVVYNKTACPEFVNEYTGCIMHDSSDILNAIEVVLKRNNMMGRDNVRKECRDFVLNNFNMATNIEKYLDLFMYLIAVKNGI